MRHLLSPPDPIMRNIIPPIIKQRINLFETKSLLKHSLIFDTRILKITHSHTNNLTIISIMIDKLRIIHLQQVIHRTIFIDSLVSIILTSKETSIINITQSNRLIKHIGVFE